MYKSLLILIICSSLFITMSSLQTIAIIGSNDIHGSALPTVLIRQDTLEAYNYGGLVYMARLIQILQQQYPNNTLYLDAGDQFQGGIQSSKLISSGQIMNQFYNTMNLQASGIGNHQFDFGPQFLFPYMNGKESVNLAANLRSEKGQVQFLPKQKSSILRQFPSGIRIGVIGLATLQTLTSTSGFSSGKFPLYQFLEYKRFIEDQSAKLRRAGANAVLVMGHVGDQCYGDMNYRPSWENKTQQDACLVDQITNLVRSLQPGTIDGMVQGHRHRFVHHFIDDIPYMGVINGGYYINVMYLTFDDDKNIVNSTLEGPIPVCQKTFVSNGRCNYLTEDQLANAGDLIPWRFHNKEVYAHQQLDIIFEQWRDKMKPFLVDIVVNQISLIKMKDAESELGNLMTSLMHEAVPSADFVVMNPGGFRAQWLPGIIQYQHFYNMFPFENHLYSFEINGTQLLEMISIIQNGKNGFYHFWNIFTKVTLDSVTKQKGFISAKFADGTPIEPDQTYRGLSIDFLIIDGGDDFSKVVNVTYTPRSVVNEGDFKTLIQPTLEALGTIQRNTWIDPQNPRIVIETLPNLGTSKQKK